MAAKTEPRSTLPSPNASTDSPETPSRRRLLKALAAGGGVAVTTGGLPERWTKPLIDSTVLPAHAQTTPGGGGAGDDSNCRKYNMTGEVLIDDPGVGCDIYQGTTVSYVLTLCISSNGRDLTFSTSTGETGTGAIEGGVLGTQYDAASLPSGIVSIKGAGAITESNITDFVRTATGSGCTSLTSENGTRA